MYIMVEYVRYFAAVASFTITKSEQDTFIK